MVRSNWKKALVISFAWAGLVWAQQSFTSSAPTTRPALSTGQTFTVQEPGRVGQKCKILKTWRTPDGKTAYQVQSMGTGEMMTIVETGARPNLPSSAGGNGVRVQAVATRIFHWGSDRTPPAGTPMPPIEYAHTLPPAKPRLESTYPATLPRTYPTKVVTPPVWESTTPPAATISEPAKPGFFARLFPWANRSRGSTTVVDSPQYTIPGAVPVTQQTTTWPNHTGLPGSTSTRIPDQRVQTPTQGLLPPNTKSGPSSSNQPSNLSSRPKTATPDYHFGSAPTIQPKSSYQNTWMTQSKTASTTASQDQSNSNQPKTSVPNNRYSSTPITQPSSSFRNPWIIAPKSTSQVKSNTPPDKASTTPAPRSTSSSPYFPTNPINTSRTNLQSPAAPQRVVQIIPPSSTNTSQHPTSTSTGLSGSWPTTSYLNRQAVPSTPGGKTTYLPAAEKKPADAKTTSNGQALRPWTAQPPTVSTVTPPKTAPASPSLPWPRPTVPSPSTTTPTWPKTSTTTSSLAWPRPTGTTPSTITPTSPKSSATTPSLAWPRPTATTPSTITPTSPKSSATTPSLAWPRPTGTTPSTVTPTTVKPTVVSPNMAWPTSAPLTQAATIYQPKVSTLIPYYPVAPTNPHTSAMKQPGTAVGKPASVTPAPLTDWRRSWGKMDEASVPSTAKPAQSSTGGYLPPIKPALPQADSKRPDPLQSPEQFNRLPAEVKPISRKSDPLVVPAAAVTSTAPVKPVVMSTAVYGPIHSGPASMSVPLGAQSVVQAGNPGPGGVRYVPVPMVTIPDIRRSPAPPMTNPAQVYDTPAGMMAGTNANQMNAFTPAPARQTFARATNAFGSGAPAVMSAPYGSTNIMNSGLVSTSFQGTALSNPIVPAAYHTMASQPLPPSAPLMVLRPTPENIHLMQVTLRDSLYPSQREWAAESMAVVNWRTHPQVVQALTTAAKEDPAATVRASCVRCLATMKVNTLPVINVVRGLQSDSDPRVRQEVGKAWSVLAGGGEVTR